MDKRKDALIYVLSTDRIKKDSGGSIKFYGSVAAADLVNWLIWLTIYRTH
jgi:hypothetical protein